MLVCFIVVTFGESSVWVIAFVCVLFIFLVLHFECKVRNISAIYLLFLWWFLLLLHSCGWCLLMLSVS